MKRFGKRAFFIFLLCAVVLSVPRYEEAARQAVKFASADTLVIDAGHGGIDGGAESADGTIEKEINLAIAKEIAKLAERDGWRVIMTREKDESLGKRDGSIRSRKTQDLKARKEIIDREEPLASVSIHMNSFKEDPRVRGAQVFYPRGPEEEKIYAECRALAQAIQTELTGGMDDGAERTALSRKGVLIFKNPKTPIVIVECGFLSNQVEATLLQREDYQKKLANLIYNGIMDYTGKETVNVELIDSKGNMKGV